jgi:hypothetical protein
MVDEGQNTAFYDNLCQLIEKSENIMSSTTHKYAPLKEDIVNYVEGAYYSNLIKLYRNNLNKKFFKMVKISDDDRDYLVDILKPFFEKAEQTSNSSFNKGNVDFHLYQDFRRLIYDFGDDVYWLLLGVEKYADIIRCEHRIIQFKNELSEL